MALIPEYIGPYRVLRSIAVGGMAEVYEVQDPASEERLALKLLVAVRAALDRFDREYEAMTRLNHPGIVRVYHYGLHQGHPWLTMELLRGVPAQSHIKRIGQPGTPQRLREVLRMGYHVAMALNYIHDRKLVHRDVKSANVLVLPDDRIKVLDLGAAHLIDGQRITQEGEFVGTFAYASPEQIMGKAIDHRSDLYSLGVLLFRLATGRRPFNSRDSEQLVRAHLREAPPDPRGLVSDLPEELCRVILSLLAKRPDQRPTSAEEVARALEHLHGRPFSARSRLAIHEITSASRGAERRALWDYFDTDDASTLVVVSGEDGSDRVRFLDTLQQEAADRAWGAYLCMLRRGDALKRLVATLVQMAQDCDDVAQAEPLVDVLRRCSAGPALAQPLERARLRQAAADLARLRTRGGQGALLLIQEVHRADPFTLELLAAMSRALQGERHSFRLVASIRASTLQKAPFARALTHGHVISLTSLSPTQVAVAVGNMLGRRPPSAELSRRLHTVTAGQPLYVEQAVQRMVASGGLEAQDNRLLWADEATEVPAPDAAVKNAERALRGLPVAWLRIVEAIVVADDAKCTATLAQMTGWRPAEVQTVLEELHEAGVVVYRPSGEGPLEWRHPWMPRLVADVMHPARACVLRRRLAEASGELPPSKGAVHALVEVGEHDQAARSAVALARALLKGHEVRSALETLEPVVRTLGQAEIGADGIELLLCFADCLRRVRPTDPENGKLLARARALAEEEGSELTQARLDLAQARLFMAIGHYGNYRKYLLQGWGRGSTLDHAPLAAALATELARSYRWHGDLGRAETWVERALGAGQDSGDLALLGEAVLQSAACMTARGQLADAEQAYSLALDDFRQAGDDPGFWRALAQWTNVLRLQGRYSEALSQLHQRLPEASQSQDPAPYVELLQAAAWVELDLSRLGRAQEYTDELAAAVGRGEHLHLRLQTKLLTGRIMLASGQLRSAAYLLQEVQRSARNAELIVLAERARASLAETLHQLGDHATAASLFQSAVLGLLGAGDLTVLAEGVRCRARTLATRQDPQEIFRPVGRLLQEEPMALLRLEEQLARGEWHHARGAEEASRQAYREAAMVLNVLATSLNDTDRAALRVHPWSTRIRQGLRAAAR